MRWLATLAVVVVSALMSPRVASGYTFGDWARAEGYDPNDAMPSEVWASGSSIDSLDGIGEFDWTTTPTTELYLDNNQISSIEPGALIGLANLRTLDLYDNQISSIESGDLSGLTNLLYLYLDDNQISSIESGDFNGLTNLSELWLDDNQISSIESDDFNGLTNLTVLRLRSNQLSSIESGDFSGLTNLERLYLDGNQLSSIESGDFNGLANLQRLYLDGNQLSSIESDDFNGLVELRWLSLSNNQVSSIESGDFNGLVNLEWLYLHDNQILSIDRGAFSGLAHLLVLHLGGNLTMTSLNLEAADFSSLTAFDVEGNVNIARVSLRNSAVNLTSLATLLDGGTFDYDIGIGELDGITEMDLSGVDFANINDLSPLYVMDDLTDLWLVNTVNLDHLALSLLLDNLATIDGDAAEGILHMTQADFDAFNVFNWLANWAAEPGHTVELLQPGDMNHDTEVNILDMERFMDALLAGPFDVAADMNEDGALDGRDVAPFVAAVRASGGAQPVPEPATFCLTAIGLLGLVTYGWRRGNTAVCPPESSNDTT